MFLLGLTGSIGMGKSTTAQVFSDLGCAVWDADAAVHRLYSEGGKAVPVFEKELPRAVQEGRVCRDELKKMIAADPTVLKTLERLVHPLVAEDRQEFIDSSNADIIVLDIPLLFETGGDARVDAVAVVYVDVDTQKARVMARGTMTEQQFEVIRAQQMPSDHKKARADYVIHTDTLDHARAQVLSVVEQIRKRLSDA